jgi:hypothetical protein
MITLSQSLADSLAESQYHLLAEPLTELEEAERRREGRQQER